MIEESEVEARLSSFRLDLAQMKTEHIIQKHITFGSPVALRSDEYFHLKSEVAAHFEIHPTQVVMVGSGKMGFSIVSEKRYRRFGESSDIDIAIVCPELFERFWQAVFDYQQGGAYWPEKDRFVSYLFRGWIRPDKLPNTKFPQRRDWWDFFTRLTSSGQFGSVKITAGLYKSWHFFEAYQSICINQCKI